MLLEYCYGEQCMYVLTHNGHVHLGLQRSLRHDVARLAPETRLVVVRLRRECVNVLRHSGIRSA